MRDGTSATEDTKSAGMSPLRLRVGVFLILLWLVPFWALSPYIAHSLSGLSNPPSVAEVTTAILVMQTIIGLVGFWVAGTEVKAIVKGSTKRHAVAAIWSIFLHGRSEIPATTAAIRNRTTATRRRLAKRAVLGPSPERPQYSLSGPCGRWWSQF